MVIEQLDTMNLLQRRDVRFCRVSRTRHAYVVRTFDYREKLTRALDYINSLGIISVGRNAEFEYINIDEAIRRGLEVATRLDAEKELKRDV
jgi:protoporphyrinogen oxidase